MACWMPCTGARRGRHKRQKSQTRVSSGAKGKSRRPVVHTGQKAKVADPWFIRGKRQKSQTRGSSGAKGKSRRPVVHPGQKAKVADPWFIRGKRQKAKGKRQGPFSGGAGFGCTP